MLPGPGCPADGYKMVLCLCPQRPHTTVVQLEACWPEVRGIAIYVHSNPEKCPWRGPRTSTAIPKNVHGEVRGTAIYVHSNPEKCPCRGPSNSNLCPQQSRKMSMARSEEQQFIQQSRKKINHGVDPDDERSKQQIAMCRGDVPDILKNKAKAATETSSKKFQYNFKKGMRWAGCEKK